jgi:predicted dehydrogenase
MPKGITTNIYFHSLISECKQMNPPLRFAVIGLGGYAVAHLEAVAWLAQQSLAQLAGVVAWESDRKKFPQRVAALQAQGVRLFDDVEDFFKRGVASAEVLTVPIGIHQHAPVSLTAMQAGLHVYCEKPLAATLEEVDALIAARDATQRKIAVGFQHIYSRSIRQLKARIVAGRLGRVQTVSLLCGWPRSVEYYRRNDWAGKMRVGEHWVLDSPANNAHAHYLLNVLYLASPNQHTAATPRELRAELYRANPIASCDTVQAQFQTSEGVDCRVLLTHANRRELGPIMKIAGEKGRAVWQGEKGETVIEYEEGGSERFDNETHAHWRFEGFRDLAYAIRNDFAPMCSLEIARCHTQTIQAVHASCPNIVTIPERFIDRAQDWERFPPKTKGNFYRVRELDQDLQKAFACGSFLSALNVPWAKQ